MISSARFKPGPIIFEIAPSIPLPPPRRPNASTPSQQISPAKQERPAPNYIPMAAKLSTEKPKVIITMGESPSNCTFRFHEETHTVGNALRHILARDARTEYVAYTIPHPSEPYLNFRLQTYEGNAQDHLLEGLSTFADVADSILAEFERALAASTPPTTTTTTTASKKSSKTSKKKSSMNDE